MKIVVVSGNPRSKGLAMAKHVSLRVAEVAGKIQNEGRL